LRAMLIQSLSPGKCDWHFQSVAMQVTQGKLGDRPAFDLIRPFMNNSG
jgi:hypothetical protein